MECNYKATSAGRDCDFLPPIGYVRTFLMIVIWIVVTSGRCWEVSFAYNFQRHKQEVTQVKLVVQSNLGSAQLIRSGNVLGRSPFVLGPTRPCEVGTIITPLSCGEIEEPVVPRPTPRRFAAASGLLGQEGWVLRCGEAVRLHAHAHAHAHARQRSARSPRWEARKGNPSLSNNRPLSGEGRRSQPVVGAKLPLKGP